MRTIMSADTDDRHRHTHNQNEEEVLRQLLKLEEMFREHLTQTNQEMITQKDLINSLWVISQRYVIIISTTDCCKYAEEYSMPTEDVLLREYSDKLQLLRTSNCRLLDSLLQLQKECDIFRDLYNSLDLTIESEILLGDTFHKPLAFFVELADDLFKYMHALSLKLNYLSHQVDPMDLLVLEEYKTALEPSEEFEEFLLTGLSYCKCLRRKPVCSGT